MSIRRVVARNVIWNYAGMAFSMAAGFVTAPFLVNRLGATGYGLWLLIGSFTGYFGLLDLGVRGSVGRFVAFHRARQEGQAVNETLSTALAVLCVPAIITVVGTFAAAFLFFALFEVPPEQTESVRLALLIVGGNLALTFVLNIFDGTLWALQRFDLINGVDILTTSARTGLTFCLVGNGYGLTALATATLLTTLCGGALKCLAAHCICPEIHIRPRHVRFAQLRTLFGYSFWYFILSAGQMLTSQLSRILIGSWLGVALVTPFNFASSVIGYGTSLLVACTGVLTPLATSFHAGEQHDKQRHLFLEGGKCCSYFGLCFLGGCLFLGRAFLRLWIPTQADMAFSILVILAIGELLPMSQGMTGNILLGAAKHKSIALMTLLEAFIAVLAATLLVDWLGLLGPALAVASGRLICRGILLPLYGCRTMRCQYMRYVQYAFLPSIVYALVPMAALAMAAKWKPPETWPTFLVFALAYVGLCAAFGTVLMMLGTRSISFVSMVRTTLTPVPDDDEVVPSNW